MFSSDQRFFLKRMLLFCLLLAVIALLLFSTVLKNFYLNIFPVQFALIMLVTIVSHTRLMKTAGLNKMRFTTAYLATMSIKFFLYIVFMLVCLLIDRSRPVNFVISFMILYIFFTIFEVTELSNFLRKNSNSSN